MKNHKLLTEYPVLKVLLHYAFPAVMGLLFYGIQNVIDGIIVGQFLGTNALAAINLILPFYSAIAVVAIMTGVGTQATIGISMGKQDLKTAQNAITSGAIFVFFGCLIMAIPAYIFAPKITLLFGANQELYPHSLNYMRGLLIMSPFIGMMFFSDSMLKITGHPRFAFIILSISLFINITLNILFITQFNLGTFGIGLATGTAFTIGTLMSSFILLNKKRQKITFLSGRLNLKLLKQILYNGSSEGMAELAVGVSLLIFNYTLMKYAGADGVAAFTVIGYICFIGTTIFLGVADGVIPIISYNYGAGNLKRVKKVVILTAKINLGIGIIIFSLLIFFAGDMVKLFVGDNENDVVKLAINGASIYAFAFIIEGLNLLFSAYYTATSRAKYSFIIASMRGLIFILLGLTILPKFFGIVGIWITVPISELLTLIIATLHYKYSRKN